MLTVDAYFDFKAHPFEHEALFRREGISTVVDVLEHIGPYCQEWLDALPVDSTAQDTRVSRDEWPDCICEGTFAVVAEPGAHFSPDRIIGSDAGNAVYLASGAQVRGGTFDVTSGSVCIGEGATVQGAWVCGPVIIGEGTSVRPGAYLRGNVILGRNDVVRGELKNAVVMDEADFPHPSYLGDSICGYGSHFGNQATAANVNIFGGKDSIKLKVNDQTIDLGRRKVGIIMGDCCQVGCNAVSDPGTFLLPHTIVYSLSRIKAGVYGPNEILKNKPLEHGVIERVPLRRGSSSPM